MGIYDRDYYRRERPGLFSALSGSGRICTSIIVINVILFIVQMQTRESYFGRIMPNSGPFTETLEFNFKAVMHGQVWRLLTYAFLHSTNDIWHIVFNMLLFWMVGRELEDLYGPAEFLAFYVVGALAGGLGQFLTDWTGLTVGGPMIGASGAVTACMVLFAMHFPKRVFYFMLVIPMPVIVLVVLYVGIDALGLVSGQNRGVAVACHLGGALFGFLYYKLGWRLARFQFSLPKWKTLTRRQPRLRVFRGETDEEPVSVSAGSRGSPDSELEAELDAVLEKVSRYGQSSLNDREQKILQRASEIYRNRRK